MLWSAVIVALWASLWSTDGSGRPTTTAATDPIDLSREFLWPVCRSGNGDDPQTDPRVVGCEFFDTEVPRTRFEPPTSEDDHAFWERVNQSSSLTGATWYACQGLNAEQRTRFEAARAYALSARAPTELWHWSDVLDIIDTVGDEIALCVVTENEDQHSGEYSALLDEMSFSEEMLNGPTDRLAAVLVHEATHAAYYRLLERITGIHSHDLAWADLRCGDIREVQRRVNEAVAYLNEAIWMGANMPLSDEHELWLAEHALRARRGELTALAVYARYITAHAMLNYEMPFLRRLVYGLDTDEARAERRRAHELACGPFVRIDPDGSGWYISPADVDTAFLTDVLELSELPFEDTMELYALDLE